MFQRTDTSQIVQVFLQQLLLYTLVPKSIKLWLLLFMLREPKLCLRAPEQCTILYSVTFQNLIKYIDIIINMCYVFKNCYIFLHPFEKKQNVNINLFSNISDWNISLPNRRGNMKLVKMNPLDDGYTMLYVVKHNFFYAIMFASSRDLNEILLILFIREQYIISISEYWRYMPVYVCACAKWRWE